MFNAIMKWTNSFGGAMILAVASFLCLIVEILAGNSWAWVYVPLVLYWVWVAFRAVNPRPEDTAPEDMSLEQMRFRLQFLEQVSAGLDKTIKDQIKMIEEKEKDDVH